MTTSHDRAREALKTLGFLGGLPDPVLDQLASRAPVKRYGNGETIVARDDAGRSRQQLDFGKLAWTRHSPQGSMSLNGTSRRADAS